MRTCLGCSGGLQGTGVRIDRSQLTGRPAQSTVEIGDVGHPAVAGGATADDDGPFDMESVDLVHCVMAR